MARQDPDLEGIPLVPIPFEDLHRETGGDQRVRLTQDPESRRGVQRLQIGVRTPVGQVSLASQAGVGGVQAQVQLLRETLELDVGPDVDGRTGQQHREGHLPLGCRQRDDPPRLALAHETDACAVHAGVAPRLLHSRLQVGGQLGKQLGGRGVVPDAAVAASRLAGPPLVEAQYRVASVHELFREAPKVSDGLRSRPVPHDHGRKRSVAGRQVEHVVQLHPPAREEALLVEVRHLQGPRAGTHHHEPADQADAPAPSHPRHTLS